MLLERVFRARSGDRSALHYLEFPETFELEPGLTLTLKSDDNSIELILRERIRNEQLTPAIQLREVSWDTTEEQRCVDVSGDRASVQLLASDVVAGLSVLLERPLSLFSSAQPDRIVPEDLADEEKIAELGADKLRFGLRAGLPTSFQSRGGITEQHICDLMPRTPGLHLYADALKNTVTTASYRDYWRVLESAFNKIDDHLIPLLVQYPPVVELGFDETELRNLHTLRGRASHASSRSGLDEIREVNKLCETNLPRLRELAKRVITTKRSWGYPTLGVNEVDGYTRVETAKAVEITEAADGSSPEGRGEKE